MTPVARFTETPAFIETSDDTLFGILTEPADGRGRVGVIHLRGGNQGPSSGRNRVSAVLCRRLAEDGYSALRFDYRGVGDSTGEIHGFRHDVTFETDVQAWAAWLVDRGVKRFVLVGECFGARTALASADLPGVSGMVLLSLPVRDAEKRNGVTVPLVRHRTLVGYAVRALRPATLRGWKDPRMRRRYLTAARGALRAAAPPAGGSGSAWVSNAVSEQLRSAVRRGIPLLLLHGTTDPGFEDFKRAQAGPIGKLLADGSAVRVETLAGRLAAWADIAVQERAVAHIANWLASLPSMT